MSAPKQSYEIDGRKWLSLARAAQLIGTNLVGIRKLMADGSLDWTQTRVNSQRLVVAEEGVLRIRRERKQWLKEVSPQAR